MYNLFEWKVFKIEIYRMEDIWQRSYVLDNFVLHNRIMELVLEPA